MDEEIQSQPYINMTKLLDLSREYWNRRGVLDWGLVIDAEK